jgi:hypothetical protein
MLSCQSRPNVTGKERPDCAPQHSGCMRNIERLDDSASNPHTKHIDAVFRAEEGASPHPMHSRRPARAGRDELRRPRARATRRKRPGAKYCNATRGDDCRSSADHRRDHTDWRQPDPGTGHSDDYATANHGTGERGRIERDSSTGRRRGFGRAGNRAAGRRGCVSTRRRRRRSVIERLRAHRGNRARGAVPAPIGNHLAPI